MMFLKIMGDDDLPDHDNNKPHELVIVSDYAVNRGVDGDAYIRYRQDGHDVCNRVYSNIYVMNADGKTINTITPKRFNQRPDFQSSL